MIMIMISFVSHKIMIPIILVIIIEPTYHVRHPSYMSWADLTVDGLEWIEDRIHSTPVDCHWSGFCQDSSGVEWIIQWRSSGIGPSRSNNHRSTWGVP
jgi:hypothetical protein